MADGPRPPNFLFVFPDQWRGDCLAHLGHPAVETPCLTDLAAEGVTFTSAYTPCPSCVAARACLITGQTPSTAGRMGYRDGVPWRYPTTLMRCLRDAGYQTINVGKTHFYPQRANLGFEVNEVYDTQVIDPGFESDYDRWLDRMSGGQLRDTTREMNSNSWHVAPWLGPEHLHPNSWTSTVAIEHLGRRDPTRPFFLTLAYHRPHPPLDPPLAWLERFADKPLPPVPVGDWAAEFDRPVARLDACAGRLPADVLDRAQRAYYAQVAHLDFQIGRVIWWMQKYGKCYGDTYVVFASDHGEMLGDHHLWRKFVPFEGSAKVPLIVRPPPGRPCPRGSRCDLPVTLSDLMPTFLEEAGVENPPTVEGRSLAPLVRGDRPSEWRGFVHGEHARPDAGWQFVTDGREKYAWDSLHGREWFFDLAADPRELRNLVAAPAEAGRVERWRRRLVEVLAARPQDGLSDGERLIAGLVAPTVRPELLATTSGGGATRPG